jgi:hypothetical protein
VALHNGGRGPVQLHHGLRRKEKKHSANSGISPVNLFLSFLFPLSVLLSFSDVGKEVRRERWLVREDARVREGDRQLL